MSLGAGGGQQEAGKGEPGGGRGGGVSSRNNWPGFCLGRWAGRQGGEGAAEKATPPTPVRRGEGGDGTASPSSRANSTPCPLPEPRAEIDGTAASLGPGWI